MLLLQEHDLCAETKGCRLWPFSWEQNERQEKKKDRDDCEEILYQKQERKRL